MKKILFEASIAHFSKAKEQVKEDGEIAIAYERKREGKRKLGTLEGKAEIIFKDDFKITDEEFLGLK